METINLGGEEYYVLKKEEIDSIKAQKDKAEQDLKNIQTIVGNAFKGLDGLIGLKQSVPEKKTASTGKKYKNRDRLFEPASSAQMLWKISDIDMDGSFYGVGRRKLKVSIKDVFKLKEIYHKGLTYGEVSDLQEELGLDYQMMHRLIYNYEKNIFDKWMVRWNSMTQPKVGMQHKPLVNNPEKRKESGYF